MDPLTTALTTASQDKKLLNKVYDDLVKPLVQPAIRNIGIALGDIFGMLPTITLSFVLLKEKGNLLLKENLKRFEAKLMAVPEAKMIQVIPEIGVPIVEKLTHTSHERISDMFLELLKKSSHKDEVGMVHPKYIQIISNLTGDEALLIDYLRSQPSGYGIPLIDFIIYPKKGDRSMIEMGNNMNNLDTKVNFDFPENIEIYLNNLVSLGILSSEGKLPNSANAIKDYSMIEKKYEHIVENNKKALALKGEGGKVVLKKTALWVTALGESFMQAIS